MWKSLALTKCKPNKLFKSNPQRSPTTRAKYINRLMIIRFFVMGGVRNILSWFYGCKISTFYQNRTDNIRVFTSIILSWEQKHLGGHYPEKASAKARGSSLHDRRQTRATSLPSNLLSGSTNCLPNLSNEWNKPSRWDERQTRRAKVHPPTSRHCAYDLEVLPKEDRPR